MTYLVAHLIAYWLYVNYYSILYLALLFHWSFLLNAYFEICHFCWFSLCRINNSLFYSGAIRFFPFNILISPVDVVLTNAQSLDSLETSLNLNLIFNLIVAKMFLYAVLISFRSADGKLSGAINTPSLVKEFTTSSVLD